VDHATRRTRLRWRRSKLAQPCIKRFTSLSRVIWTLGLPAAPRQRQRGPDCGTVLLQPLREGRDDRHATRARLDQPSRQIGHHLVPIPRFADAAALHDPGEAANEGNDLRRLLRHCPGRGPGERTIRQASCFGDGDVVLRSSGDRTSAPASAACLPWSSPAWCAARPASDAPCLAVLV
jgi:hypothetical protein